MPTKPITKHPRSLFTYLLRNVNLVALEKPFFRSFITPIDTASISPVIWHCPRHFPDHDSLLSLSRLLSKCSDKAVVVPPLHSGLFFVLKTIKIFEIRIFMKNSKASSNSQKTVPVSADFYSRCQLVRLFSKSIRQSRNFLMVWQIYRQDAIVKTCRDDQNTILAAAF